MSQLTKNLKTALRRTINSFGYDMHKLPPQPRKTSEVVEILIAGKTLKIHGGNPLRLVYQQNPDCNHLMAQAVKLIQEKYPTAWAVDVGANIGDTLAVIRSQANLPVICVEGDRHCYELLEENARQFDNIHVFNVFLSNQPGSAFVETEKEGWNTTLSETQPNKAGQQVKFETLDVLVGNLGCQTSVKFIKVDTEGYDMRILRGAYALLTSAKPVITFELNKDNIEPLGDDFPKFLAYLIGFGYDYFFLTDPHGNPVCTLGAGDERLFASLYNFSGYGHAIHYFDVWTFHRNDRDLFDKFMALEKILPTPAKHL
jgi:FkbM family methyltransferase